jgi:hypothetical protein
MPQTRLIAALRLFCEREIDFIIVGGLAAVLNGAPVQTYGIDLVYARTSGNIGRLLPLPAEIDAIFRIQPDRRFRPEETHLSGSGHMNLLTTFGPIDLLATIGEGLTYEDLLSQSASRDIGEGRRVCVLTLECLIDLKSQSKSAKDTAVIPILRQTLIERNRKGPK